MQRGAAQWDKLSLMRLGGGILKFGRDYEKGALGTQLGNATTLR